MPRLTNLLTLLLAALIVAGCTTLGPDYSEAPPTDTQESWDTEEGQFITAGSGTNPRWWQDAFNDPKLDELIEDAIQQNLTLRSAGLRVLQSQQILAIAVGNQYPQEQQISGNAQREQEYRNRENEYNVGFNLTWELDFWGRFKRQIESASADLDASIADYDEAMISLVAQVAQSYLVLRTNQERLAIARKNIALQKESLRIAQAKLNAGDTSELDVDQAESLLHNTRALVPSLETSIQQSKNSIALLLGRTPSAFNKLTGSGELPATIGVIPLGMPQDLLRQRPDVRSAERQLASQSAQIGFAITDLYPQLSIGGSIGSLSMESSDLFNSDSETWSIFGGFQWNVLNYGRLKSNIRLQDALFQQLLEDYRFTVLQAQVDVENAIIAYLKSREQVKAYLAASDASQRAVDVATNQYQNGLVDYNTVITTLNSLQQQQDTLASTKGAVTANMVQVFRALGGGWQTRDDRDPVELLPEATKEELKSRTSYWESSLK